MPGIDKSKLATFVKKSATMPRLPAKPMPPKPAAPGPGVDPNDGFIKPQPPPVAAAPAPAAVVHHPTGAIPPPAMPAAPAAPAAPGAAPVPGAPPAVDDAQLPAMVEQAAQQAEASADPDLEDLVVDYDQIPPGQPPSWALDPALWQKATQAVGLGTPEADERYDEPFVVAAYLYKMLGGPLGPPEQVIAGDSAPEKKAPKDDAPADDTKE